MDIYGNTQSNSTTKYINKVLGNTIRKTYLDKYYTGEEKP